MNSVEEYAWTGFGAMRQIQRFGGAQAKPPCAWGSGFKAGMRGLGKASASAAMRHCDTHAACANGSRRPDAHLINLPNLKAVRPPKHQGAGPGEDMIKWAIIFAIIGIIAGVLGFGGLAGASMGIAKFLFWAGIIIAVILFVIGMAVAKKVT